MKLIQLTTVNGNKASINADEIKGFYSLPNGGGAIEFIHSVDMLAVQESRERIMDLILAAKPIN